MEMKSSSANKRRKCGLTQHLHNCRNRLGMSFAEEMEVPVKEFSILYCIVHETSYRTRTSAAFNWSEIRFNYLLAREIAADQSEPCNSGVTVTHSRAGTHNLNQLFACPGFFHSTIKGENSVRSQLHLFRDLRIERRSLQ